MFQGSTIYAFPVSGLPYGINKVAILDLHICNFKITARWIRKFEKLVIKYQIYVLHHWLWWQSVGFLPWEIHWKHFEASQTTTYINWDMMMGYSGLSDFFTFKQFWCIFLAFSGSSNKQLQIMDSIYVNQTLQMVYSGLVSLCKLYLKIISKIHWSSPCCQVVHTGLSA